MRVVAEVLFRREPGQKFDKRYNTSIRLVAFGYMLPIMTLLRRGLQMPIATSALGWCT